MPPTSFPSTISGRPASSGTAPVSPRIRTPTRAFTSFALATPRPPSTTGTMTWLISSTSPAPLKVPPPASRSFRMPRTRRILSSATFTSTWSLPQKTYETPPSWGMGQVGATDLLADEEDHVVALHLRVLEAQLALRIRAEGETPGAGIGDMIGALDPAPRRPELHAAAGELLHGGGAPPP